MINWQPQITVLVDFPAVIHSKAVVYLKELSSGVFEEENHQTVQKSVAPVAMLSIHGLQACGTHVHAQMRTARQPVRLWLWFAGFRGRLTYKQCKHIQGFCVLVSPIVRGKGSSSIASGWHLIKTKWRYVINCRCHWGGVGRGSSGRFRPWLIAVADKCAAMSGCSVRGLSAAETGLHFQP